MVCINRYAGLHCKIICGKAKGKDYKPADSCNDEKYQHCWNAICVDGNWFPVDTKWAAKRKVTQYHSRNILMIFKIKTYLISPFSQINIFFNMPENQSKHFSIELFSFE